MTTIEPLGQGGSNILITPLGQPVQADLFSACPQPTYTCGNSSDIHTYLIDCLSALTSSVADSVDTPSDLARKGYVNAKLTDAAIDTNQQIGAIFSEDNTWTGDTNTFTNDVVLGGSVTIQTQVQSNGVTLTSSDTLANVLARKQETIDDKVDFVARNITCASLAVPNNTFSIAKTSGLQTALDSKQPTVDSTHQITKACIVDLVTDLSARPTMVDLQDGTRNIAIDVLTCNQIVAANQTIEWNELSIANNDIPQVKVDGLVADLGTINTQITSHSNAIGTLQETVAEKQDIIQDGGLAIAKVAGLRSELDGIESAFDGYVTSSVFSTAMDSKQPTIQAGDLSISQVYDLQSLLDDKVEIGNFTKTALGLANVDNTSDANKPISTACRTELDALQEYVGTLATTLYVDSLVLSGPTGEAGLQGVQGDQGLKGDQGDKGDKGDQGDAGLPGAQGDQGLKGDQGDQGLKGDQGDKGDKGDQGDAGLPGAQGDQGLKGDQGDKGDKGDQGDAGLPGAQGDMGPAGEKGDKGDKGDQGDAGLPGATGATGPAGLNFQVYTTGATLSALDPGDGTKTGQFGLVLGGALYCNVGAGQGIGPSSSFVFVQDLTDDSIIIGPRGDTGAQGPAGATGATGAQGPAGELSSANESIDGIKTFTSAPVMSGASISNGTVPDAALVSTFVKSGQAPALVGTNFSGIPVSAINSGDFAALSIAVQGNISAASISEKIVTVGNNGTTNSYTVDYAQSAVFVLSTAPTANMTVRLNNAGTDTSKTITFSILYNAKFYGTTITAYSNTTSQITLASSTPLFLGGASNVLINTSTVLVLQTFTLCRNFSSAYVLSSVSQFF